jgi:hypothetical protein
MSTIKPDYYIAHNGLPNIINEHRNRHKPSRIPTIEYKSNNSSSCRTLRNSKNEKDLINQRIAATRTTTTLSNCANIGDNNNRNKSSSNNNNYNVENYEKNYRRYAILCVGVGDKLSSLMIQNNNKC